MIWLVFGVMLLAGALVVALPMLVHQRRFTLLSATAIFVVVAIAVGLYSRIGSPGAESGAGELPRIGEMVARLEERLQRNPEDVDGWKMLGRSYVQLEQYGKAVYAFETALEREGGENGQTLADLGEAVLFAAGGTMTDRAAELFESAVSLAPHNQKALFYAGVAAIERGNRSRAADRWEALLALSPPPEIQEILKTRIAEWRGEAPPAPAPQPETSGAVATVDVSLGEAAAQAVPAEATVFVIARDPAQPSPPIAAVRRRVSELPDTVSLSDADAMIPGRTLSAQRRLEIVARVSLSGQPMEQAGDWYGTLQMNTAESTTGRVVIDRVVE